jgi:hypothetical protein
MQASREMPYFLRHHLYSVDHDLLRRDGDRRQPGRVLPVHGLRGHCDRQVRGNRGIPDPFMPPVPAASTTSNTTSPISPGSTIARSTACLIGCAASLGDSMFFSAPRMSRPIGVSGVDTITASLIP